MQVNGKKDREVLKKLLKGESWKGKECKLTERRIERSVEEIERRKLEMEGREGGGKPRDISI